MPIGAVETGTVFDEATIDPYGICEITIENEGYSAASLSFQIQMHK